MYDEDFVESDHTNAEVAEFYNACKYTPDDVPTNTERLTNGDYVPVAELADIYWSNATKSWQVADLPG